MYIIQYYLDLGLRKPSMFRLIHTIICDFIFRYIIFRYNSKTQKI